jgi:hypothetical protein
MYKHKIDVRREVSQVWENENPILEKNEMGVEIILGENRKPVYYNIKLGNGITLYNNLNYFYKNLTEDSCNEIVDDFYSNIATRKPVEDFIAMYGPNDTLKTGEPVDDDDVARLKDLNNITTDVGKLEQDISDLSDSFDTHKSDTSAHSATATPAADKIAMYNEDSGLKSGKIPSENNDVIRFLEFNNEISGINSKISTLNGAYYVLDAYNFGKILDETNPDDINILNTYAIANTPDAGSMADVYNDTVIINEFDTSEFVYNKISDTWVKYPNGFLTIATNDHLGVVKGTQPPADPADESKDTYVQVLADGAMKLVGDRLGKVNTVDSVAPDINKDISLFERITSDEAQQLIDNPDLAVPGKKYYVPETGDLLIERPDYSNRETINRIPTSGGSWTADRTGFAYVDGYSNGNAGVAIYVNNQIISENSVISQSGGGEIVAISKGDVIRLEGGSYSRGCWFIPSKFTVVKNPTLVIEEGSDYSFDEQPVMIRLPDGTLKQKTHIDGKTIWRKTITYHGTLSATDTNLGAVASLLSPDLYHITDVTNFFFADSPYDYFGNVLTTLYVDSSNLHASVVNITNAPCTYYFTVEYTKV